MRLVNLLFAIGALLLIASPALLLNPEVRSGVNPETGLLSLLALSVAGLILVLDREHRWYERIVAWVMMRAYRQRERQPQHAVR